MESGWERDVEIHKGLNLCLYGGSVGGGVDGSDGGGGVDGSSGNSGVGDGGESIGYRSGGGGGSVVQRSVGGRLCRSG